MVSVQLGAAQAERLIPTLGSTGTASLRVLFAAVMLAPFLFARRPRLDAAALAAVAAYGICLAAMNATFYAALARCPLGPTVAIEFIGPLLLAICGSRRPRDLLFVALAAAGLAFLVQPWRTTSGLDPVGAFLALGAGALWACYILAGRVLGRRLGAGGAGLGATALGMTVAALVLLPCSLVAAPAVLRRPVLLGMTVLMALFSSAIPYSIEMMAMRRLSMRVFAILMSFEPVVAALAGLALLGQALSAVQWLAIGAIVAASLGSAAGDADPPEATDYR